MAGGAAAPPIPAGLTPEQLLDIYYYLCLTRRLEARLVALYRQGKVIGGLYRSLGQEGESVASAYALGPGDMLSPLIRNLGSMLVRGAKPVEILRQYMAKATSPTAGREMNVHFNDLDLGYLGQISHLGDMVPVMAGITLTFKLRGERRVGLVYAGDGATSAGAFHEGVNFAAVQRAPLVVIVEHNGYAYSTPTSRQTAVKRLADKAKAYGIPAEIVDGNDVFAVYEVSRRAVDRARDGGGVTMIEVLTYRRMGHAEHDDQHYQPKEEMAEWARRDPVDRFVKRVADEGWIAGGDLEAIEHRAASDIDVALAECENDPLPEPHTALGAVYAQDTGNHRAPDTAPLWFRLL